MPLSRNRDIEHIKRVSQPDPFEQHALVAGRCAGQQLNTGKGKMKPIRQEAAQRVIGRSIRSGRGQAHLERVTMLAGKFRE